MGRPFPCVWEVQRAWVDLPGAWEVERASVDLFLVHGMGGTFSLCMGGREGMGRPFPGAWEVERAWVDLFLVHGRYRGHG